MKKNIIIGILAVLLVISLCINKEEPPMYSTWCGYNGEEITMESAVLAQGSQGESMEVQTENGKYYTIDKVNIDESDFLLVWIANDEIIKVWKEAY